MVNPPHTMVLQNGIVGGLDGFPEITETALPTVTVCSCLLNDPLRMGVQRYAHGRHAPRPLDL